MARIPQGAGVRSGPPLEDPSSTGGGNEQEQEPREPLGGGERSGSIVPSPPHSPCPKSPGSLLAQGL